MVSFLPGPILGAVSFLLWVGNTIVACTVIYILAVIKFLSPLKSLKIFWSKALAATAEIWISVNSFFLLLTQKIAWHIDIRCSLDSKSSYLILANHQSWVDIMVLQRVLNRKVPFMRFFIKKELFWVPLLGLAWWALDFPFLHRYSSDYIRRHPEMTGKDFETTRKNCAKFRDLPTSILIFAEGTRFTREKYQKLKSPYKHLLPPKSGGISTALEVMGDQFKSVLDVTIHYPDGSINFFDLLSGKISEIWVTIESYNVPHDLLAHLEEHRGRGYQGIKDWVRNIWQKKDEALESTFGQIEKHTI